MEHDDHLGEFEALVLTSVVHAGAGANGTAVYRDIETRTGRAVTLPSVHVTLRRLEEKGLLTSTVGEPSARGGRPRRFYRATAEGIRALRDFQTMWRKAWRGLRLPGSETRS
ncbi:MAG: PadR family transcriptional regulator [Vicinamibacterales bacterium]